MKRSSTFAARIMSGQIAYAKYDARKLTNVGNIYEISNAVLVYKLGTLKSRDQPKLRVSRTIKMKKYFIVDSHSKFCSPRFVRRKA